MNNPAPILNNEVYNFVHNSILLLLANEMTHHQNQNDSYLWVTRNFERLSNFSKILPNQNKIKIIRILFFVEQNLESANWLFERIFFEEIISEDNLMMITCIFISDVKQTSLTLESKVWTWKQNLFGCLDFIYSEKHRT